MSNKKMEKELSNFKIKETIFGVIGFSILGFISIIWIYVAITNPVWIGGVIIINIIIVIGSVVCGCVLYTEYETGKEKIIKKWENGRH